MSELTKLLENCTLEQILLFVLLLAAGYKWLVDYRKWNKKEMEERHLMSPEKAKKEREEMKQAIDKNVERLDEMQQMFSLIIDSDRQAIKAWIISVHHEHCVERKYIDDYTMDAVEQRYAIYQKENGNSFVHQLVDELRELHKECR